MPANAPHLQIDPADPDESPVRARMSRILDGSDFPALSKQIIETISALDDDASSLQRLATRLKGWAGPAGAADRLARLSLALTPVCAQLAEQDPARGQCNALLATGS